MKIFVFIFLVIGFQACKSPTKSTDYSQESKGDPKFAIQEEIHNFGTVQAGEVLSYSFRVTNNGTGDLVIDSAKVDCGCLEIGYPPEPIKAGDYNFVEVVFNSSGEVGNVLKQIQLYTNDGNDAKKLMITARVENELINIYN